MNWGSSFRIYVCLHSYLPCRYDNKKEMASVLPCTVLQMLHPLPSLLTMKEEHLDILTHEPEGPLLVR